MDNLMTKEESYAERRKLFKDIWETSMQVDEKDDIMNKPKVIKTLRLSEMDQCVAKKKKKQKIRNLRAVCNKLLDFCDRQDADDLFYEQMAAQGAEPPNHIISPQIKKKKPLKVKKKVIKAKSMLTPTSDVTTARGTTSEWKQSISKKTISRYTSPIKVKRTSIAFATPKVLKTKHSSRISTKRNNVLGDSSISRRKVVKKKRSKKNKPSDLEMPQGLKNRRRNVQTAFKRPAIFTTKKVLDMPKIYVNYFF